MSDVDPETILDLQLDVNNAGAQTVREYIAALAAEVWRWTECFSGKRPFGDSGWTDDLYAPLVKAGLIDGSFDEDGGLDDVDTVAGQAMIRDAIAHLGGSRG